MNANQLYEQAIKPLSSKEKLTIAWLIISEIETMEPEAAEPEKGFDYLQKILPSIERISLTDEDLAKVKLNGPLPRWVFICCWTRT